MRTIHIIRHEATELNNTDLQKDRIRGWQDWGLSQKGLLGAVRLAQKIRDYPPDILLSSDLTRATQTAKIIAGWNDIWYGGGTREFRPWDVGTYVGTIAANTIPILARYASQTPDVAIPMGESFNSFRNRFIDGLLGALSRYEGVIGIVTHHRNERLLKAWAKPGFPKDRSIDMEEFTRKGEQPGHWEVMEVPSA